MKTITVKGMGKVSVAPDLIVVSMRLQTEDKEYVKTMDLAAEKIDALNKSLEEVGFEKKAVKTTSFNVQTNYESVRDGSDNYKSVFKGYICIHDLKVEFDFDTKRLAKVLTAISACLVKPEFSVAFTVKDPSAVSAELLKSAAKDAKEKAEILCSASGVKLGELVSVDYNRVELNVCSNTDYKLAGRRMANSMTALASIDIEPEDIKVNDDVTFVWEIL